MTVLGIYDEPAAFWIAAFAVALFLGLLIYEFTTAGVNRIAYKDTQHYRVTHSFLDNPERSLKHLLDE